MWCFVSEKSFQIEKKNSINSFKSIEVTLNKTNRSSSRIPKLFEWFAINAHIFFQENGFSIVNYWSVLFASIFSWTVLLQLGFVLKLVTNLIRWCNLDFHRKSYFDATNLIFDYPTCIRTQILAVQMKDPCKPHEIDTMNAIRTHVPSRENYHFDYWF